MSKVYQTLQILYSKLHCTLLSCTHSSRHSRLEGLTAYFFFLINRNDEVCMCKTEGECGELQRLNNGVEEAVTSS